MVELVVVILIVGIIFSIAVVSISSLAPRYKVRSASRTLGARIEELRAVAISRGKPLGIRYSLLDDPQYYQIIPPAPEDAPEEPLEDRKLDSKTELPAGVRFRRISFPGARTVDRGVVNILLSPMGNSGSHVAVLEGSSEKGKPILISMKFNAITGTIDFSEGEVEFQDHEG